MHDIPHSMNSQTSFASQEKAPIGLPDIPTTLVPPSAQQQLSGTKKGPACSPLPLVISVSLPAVAQAPAPSRPGGSRLPAEMCRLRHPGWTPENNKNNYFYDINTSWSTISVLQNCILYTGDLATHASDQ